ncbi:response regulator [Paucibacter sp. O1-1]|uniref:response regulator n=1 Tax=Paucibacter sp. M5-1 TaxID=3015998 RepID=UPI0010F5DA15|nr:response regulator [Paucibacter sp. M5-1]MCU7374442.1 response regulator [Paucibacter sp. O1-1]MCZ7882352.1 response regulator [Paucibacter sp. M5-1]MDA3829444.1 response regulator [Paucibacter sp. O1-1]
MPARRKTLLLVDPHSLFRRTVALVARELDVADVHEASSHEAAQRLLESQTFDALLMDIGDGLGALSLLQSLRDGALRSPADLPVALTAESVDASLLALFKPLQVQRIMLKPFKVKTALEVVGALTGAPAH